MNYLPYPRRVTNFENEEVGGLAMCFEMTLERALERVSSLRTEDKLYHEALPSDPGQKLKAIIKILEGGDDDVPDECTLALHVSMALEVMLKNGEQSSPWQQESAAFMAEKIHDSLFILCEKLRCVMDIATKSD